MIVVFGFILFVPVMLKVKSFLLVISVRLRTMLMIVRRLRLLVALCFLYVFFFVTTSSSNWDACEARLPPLKAGPCSLCSITGCYGCAFPRPEEIKKEKKHKGVRKKPSGKWSAEIYMGSEFESKDMAWNVSNSGDGGTVLQRCGG